MEQRVVPEANIALRWLDLLLNREILRVRARFELSLDELRGLFVSDQQVDALIADRNTGSDSQRLLARVQEEANRLKPGAMSALNQHAEWAKTCGALALSDHQQMLLLLTWAQSLNPAYGSIFAYLNDNTSKRGVTADLALRIFRDIDVREFGVALASAEHLFRRVASDQNDAEGMDSVLVDRLSLNRTIAKYLCGVPSITTEYANSLWYLDPGVCAMSQGQTVAGVKQLAQLVCSGSSRPSAVILGRRGDGRRALASSIASIGGRELLELDMQSLLTKNKPDEAMLEDLGLYSEITGCLTYLSGFQEAFDAAGAMAESLTSRLRKLGANLLVPVSKEFPWSRELVNINPVAVTIENNSADASYRLWTQSLNGNVADAEQHIRDTALQFDLSPGQIEQAAQWVNNQQELNRNVDGAIDGNLVGEAARLQCVGCLDRLAEKIDMEFELSQLVLPAATLYRITDIISAARNRHIAFHEWGLKRRIGGSTGLVILFSGGSGTGKTMTASIIAREIGLEIYRINLASVVSKFIGETEKNLERIFDAAATSNCVLFFDEAEALFGKRSEVKDAHDRYANLETAFLLQKIERHDGIVILATNIAKHMDIAFSRRIHFAVEFPAPNQDLRKSLWRSMIPAEAPVRDDVDFDFLSRQFELTGGEIRNVILDAALNAAANSAEIGMDTIVKALSRLLLKKGRTPTSRDFKQFSNLLEHGRPMDGRGVDAFPAVEGGVRARQLRGSRNGSKYPERAQ